MGLARGAPRSFGEYRLVRLMATGGMAEVYEAHRAGAHGFTRRVVVKRVLPQLAHDPRVMAMFCDEARIHAALEHPNLVRVLDFGEAGDELFIAMEYVSGLSCAELLAAMAARGRTVDVAPALYIGRELLKGLAYVHSAEDEDGRLLGLVHRDVAPSNVLLGKAGEVKLADFGIVHSIESEARTQPGEVKGKLGYVSPEQAMGVSVDARSDLFSVGVLLAELLIAKPLFPGHDDLEVLTSLHRSDLSNLNRHGKHILPDVMTLLHGALSRRPEHRPQSALQFAQAVDAIAARRQLVLSSDMLSAWLADLGLISIDTDVHERPPECRPLPPRIPARASSAQAKFESVPPPLSRPQGADHLMLTVPDSPFPLAEERARSSVRAAAASVEAHQEVLRPELRSTYRLRHAHGGVSDPLPLPDVLALIATGHVGHSTEVSRDGGPFSNVGAVAELARLSRRAAYRFREPIEDRAAECWAVHPTLVPRVLYDIVLSERTGLLCAKDGTRQLRTYWLRGVPVFSSSTDPGELLGASLIAQRMVTREALERALNVGWTSSRRLGEALLAEGLIRPSLLTQALSVQRTQRLLALMRWRTGALYFVDELEPGECGPPVPSSPLKLITDAIIESYSLERVTQLLAGARRARLEKTLRADGMTVSLGLPLQHARALARAPHEPTLDDLVRQLGVEKVADPEAVMQAVFVGLCAGALKSSGWT